ncbi:hemagglutinin repeat-containing protein [Pseudomonas migulae]|uniref:Hemagglutinin repeat-containing protein n=1 Tax=Pseudomonas migulae TaxID=78543 RepID=A0ABY8MXE2_9PSED|nr:hemagglutinin repeat-containing protein [Pseudomonas migulae]WGK92050.1 hemagglutinin repeat-containing protein [Pseudomonas migulae]
MNGSITAIEVIGGRERRSHPLRDRTATTFNIGAGSATQLDAGSSISAGSKLTINAANNLTSKGQISSGGDATLTAGNDINLLAVEDRTVTRDALRRGLRTEETLTQLGSSVTAAGNLTLHAGRDLNAVASKASAGKDLNASADGDINLISAEDEHNLESRYKKGNKKVHEIDDQTRQVASEFSAGGNLSVKAAGDVTLRASNLTAGDEAYVYAGNNLNVLAAENRDYTLYDMTAKGAFGAKKTKRDEVTDVKYVGSHITSGGNLTLESGGDQLYQVAKLESGKDITLDSGGSITFEAVKDSHQESHEKSSNNLAWTSAKGKGNTDETLRQSQLVAQGRLVIKAVEGLKIDIKQVDQQSVSQTIDAMVNWSFRRCAGRSDASQVEPY